jgi:hypothetical protein
MEFCALAKLLKLFWTGQQLNETKFLRLGETEIPRLLNTIPLGNSLHFPMIHFTTLNSQRLTSYGYRKMAGLLNREKSGQTVPFGISLDLG